MLGTTRTLTLIAGLTAAVGAPFGAQAPSGTTSGAACSNMWPAWSHDGTRLVFVSDRTGDPEVYVQELDGTAAQRLTYTPGRDAHPSFSPGGRQIAFQSPREGIHTNLYLMDADGANQRRITSHTGFAGMPVWSPDGRFLAYQWTPDLEAAKWRLMLLEIATGTTRQLTDGRAQDQVINWAPDGKRFVFHSDRFGKNQLLSLTLDGAVQRLTTTAFDDRNGAWFPDGSRIAFLSDREGSPGRIFTMRADGTDPRRVATLAVGHGVPFVSPDGRRVLVSPRAANGSEIWAVDVANGSAARLVGCEPTRR